MAHAIRVMLILELAACPGREIDAVTGCRDDDCPPATECISGDCAPLRPPPAVITAELFCERLRDKGCELEQCLADTETYLEVSLAAGCCDAAQAVLACTWFPDVGCNASQCDGLKRAALCCIREATDAGLNDPG